VTTTRHRLFLVSLSFCLLGVLAILLPGMLGKDGSIGCGRITWSMVVADPGGPALLTSPLAGVALLCFWWRNYRLLSQLGILAAAGCFAFILWGNLTDYLSWRP